jgi:GntR family transcriptional regulator
MQFNNNGQAIYLQIVDYVCERVLLKEWKPGDKIPSVRELAVELEVNPNTIMRAYEFLKNQDIIIDKRGIGYFLMDTAAKHALRFRKSEFTEKEMPLLFRTLYMLGIEPDELTTQYEKFKRKQST